MEKESKEKQEKYSDYFDIEEGQKIIFTGMFKYVADIGKFNENGEPKFKRKRIFKKVSK